MKWLNEGYNSKNSTTGLVKFQKIIAIFLPFVASDKKSSLRHLL